MATYNFATKYAKVPGPRTEDIGPNSGKRFREEVLEPLFENNTKIEIDISETTLSFGPSFLSESFGKIALKYGKKRFYEHIQIKKDTPKNIRFAQLIERYIDLALKKKK